MTGAVRSTLLRIVLPGLVLSALLVSDLSLAQSHDLGFVSRERLLREVEVGQELARAESEQANLLQGLIDQAKAQLAAEEAELATLRPELSQIEFETRTVDFDRRVRLVRRTAQERAARLQRRFQEARAAVVSAMPAILEALRKESGYRIIIDGDQVLAYSPELDLTDRAIELFNSEGPRLAVPRVDLDTPLLAPVAEGDADAETQPE